MSKSKSELKVSYHGMLENSEMRLHFYWEPKLSDELPVLGHGFTVWTGSKFCDTAVHACKVHWKYTFLHVMLDHSIYMLKYHGHLYPAGI
jgi:hypothetical protein